MWSRVRAKAGPYADYRAFWLNDLGRGYFAPAKNERARCKPFSPEVCISLLLNTHSFIIGRQINRVCCGDQVARVIKFTGTRTTARLLRTPHTRSKHTCDTSPSTTICSTSIDFCHVRQRPPPPPPASPPLSQALGPSDDLDAIHETGGEDCQYRRAATSEITAAGDRRLATGQLWRRLGLPIPFKVNPPHFRYIDSSRGASD